MVRTQEESRKKGDKNFLAPTYISSVDSFRFFTKKGPSAHIQKFNMICHMCSM